MGASTFAARARLAYLLGDDDDASIPPLGTLVTRLEELVAQAREAVGAVTPAPIPVDSGDQVLGEARAQLARALGHDVDHDVPAWFELTREANGLAGLRAGLLDHFAAGQSTTNSQLARFVEAACRRRDDVTGQVEALRNGLRALVPDPYSRHDGDLLAKVAAQLHPRELATPPEPDVEQVWTVDRHDGTVMTWVRRPGGWWELVGGLLRRSWHDVLANGPVLLDDPRPVSQQDRVRPGGGGVDDDWDDGPAGGDPDH